MIQHKNQQKHKQKLTSPKNPNRLQELTFLEHLYELRNRLFWSILAVIVTSAIGFNYKDQLIAAVMAPLRGQKLVYLTPGGGFSFIFTVSIYFGLIIAIPVIVYHLYRFVQPLMKGTSRRLVASLIFLSILFAAIGVSFGYFIAVPAALNFLTNFADGAVTPNLTADSYLSFVASYLLGLAALFQLPLLLFMFDYVKPFKPGFLSGTQQYVIIGAAVISAIITPTPDAFNMAVIAVPVVGVYELGAFAVFIHRRLRERAERSAAKSFVMPETPRDILTAVVERERPEFSGGPTRPEPQAAPRQQQLSVSSAQTMNKPQQNVRPVQFAHSTPVKRSLEGFGPAPRHAPTQVIARQTTPLVSAPIASRAPNMGGQVNYATVPRRHSLDGFGGPAQQVARPVRPIIQAAPATRHVRSLDGFSMA